jgi:hypothetical protein
VWTVMLVQPRLATMPRGVGCRCARQHATGSISAAGAGAGVSELWMRCSAFSDTTPAGAVQQPRLDAPLYICRRRWMGDAVFRTSPGRRTLHQSPSQHRRSANCDICHDSTRFDEEPRALTREDYNGFAECAVGAECVRCVPGLLSVCV